MREINAGIGERMMGTAIFGRVMKGLCEGYLNRDKNEGRDVTKTVWKDTQWLPLERVRSWREDELYSVYSFGPFAFL